MEIYTHTQSKSAENQDEKMQNIVEKYDGEGQYCLFTFFFFYDF